MSKLKTSALLLGMITGLLASSKVVEAKDFSDYYKEKMEYYINNPDEILVDARKGEIVIETGEEQEFTTFISHVSKANDLKLGDIVTLSGVGNSSCDGSGIDTKEIEFNNSTSTLGVVVGIKNDYEDPYAIATYNKDNDTVGDVIGWFKKDSLYSTDKFTATAIERTKTMQLACGLDADEESNDVVFAGPDVHRIGDTSYGIVFDYADEVPDGYYVCFYDLSYWVKKDTEKEEKAVYNPTEKILQKKYNIISR